MHIPKRISSVRQHHLIYFFVKWIITPIALVIFGLFISVFFNTLSSKEPISIISYPKAQGDKIAPIEKPLMQGEEITGEFVSQSDNLGTVAIRFGTYKRAGSDVIIFKIKENGEKDWYYEANYKVDQFQDNQLFTFGFPVIVKSKGKMYEFQIESTSGKKGDAVYVSSSEPIFVTKYKYSIKYAVLNIADTVNFIGKKAMTSSSAFKDLIQYLLLLAPLIFYVFFALFNRKLRAKVYYACFLLLVSFMLLSSEFNSLQDFRIIGILWMMGIVIFHLKSEVTLLMVGILLCLSFGALILGNLDMSEKAAMFVYWLLLVAIIEVIFEVAMRKRFERGYEDFLSLLFR